MAHFLIWIASFFTLAIFIFWRYMGSTWFTWKKKDFSKAQSELYKRLHNVIPNLEKCLKAMEESSKEKVLNKNQCVHLFRKLVLAMTEIDKMLSIATPNLNFRFVCEELFCLQRKVEIIRKQCIEEEQWYYSAIFQLQNKETFRELLLDLKCCYDSARDIYLLHYMNQSNDILPIQFDATTYEEVLEDAQELKTRLELVRPREISEDYEIAQHLLLRLRNFDRVDGGDLNALEFSSDFKTPQLIEKIGEGGYGEVFKSNWSGLPCATKVLKVERGNLTNSRKEAGILASLNHPNLVQFLGCWINKQIGEISKKDEIGEMHLVMELMGSNLSTLLEKAKRPLPYSIAIDIMHQIAKGVYYLHDMQVAHLDLKPANILSNSISLEDLDPSCIFKVTDYGTSKFEVCSNPKPLQDLEPLEQPIGTQGYMSPEMIKGSKTSSYQFQADVWSFAMICSEILSRKVPYSNLKPREFYNQIKGKDGLNLRPDLPKDCEELTILIQECWSQDPLQRPTFSKICDRLTCLKKSFLKGGCYPLRDFKSMVIHVPRVDEQSTPLDEIQVDLDHQLSKAKVLLKMNYIGIVGMGGIGKTTLAKAILDDAIMTSSYDASCFVAECKNYQNSYEILSEILPKLGKDEKLKNLGDAQKMMKKLFIAKKVLLILDDVNEETLVDDIAPPDIVQASKGTTIIITTRQWNTIKSIVGIEGKLEVELLNKKAATRLFTSHLCWDVASILPSFVALRKHVVASCNGLPLSLKVMGAFLRNKERLRSWERALQRMARGRNLDGDKAIWNILQTSFDGLNDGDEKNMFLDVASFFCRDVYPSGISKATFLSIWSKDGIPLVDKLERLVDMSLLKVNGDGDILEMHDQLRDMGRMIAKNTRIWKATMIPEIGFSNKDVEVIEGISMHGTMRYHLRLLKQDSSFDFEKLRILIWMSDLGNSVVDAHNLSLFLEIASHCSQLEAILIENSENWKTYGFQSTLPESTASLLSTKILDLCGLSASLKVFDLIGFDFLKKLPNKFASCNTLLRLNLSGCSSLVSLPKEVGNLSSLTTLDLRWCSSLVSLPKEVGNLSSLITLNLNKCSNLVSLPKEVGNLSSLTTLDLRWCSSLVSLPNKVENFSSLTTLDLSGCSSLVSLPKEVGNLSSLATLNLYKCSSLVSLPKEVGNLSSLTTLDLNGCSSLVSLSKEVGNLSSLTTLNLYECSSLLCLPNEVGNLSSLTTLDLRWCSSLVSLPKEVGNLSSLTILDLKWSSSLVSLPKEVGNLSSLTTLDLRWCSSLVSLPKEVGNLSSLTTLDLSGCSSLMSLPKEVGNFSSLTTLDLSGCSSLVSLPKEMGKLSSLATLNLYKCSSLVSLPKEVGNLSSLTTLDLSGCSSLVSLPNEVGNLSSLATFNFYECSSLVSLPKEVGNLSSLTTLNLYECSSLVSLPKEVGNLSSLTTLDLRWCSSLVSLPKEVGNLSSLTTLNLYECSSLVSLSKEVGNLSSLTFLDLRWCSSLMSLPKEVGNLSSLTTLDLTGCSSLVSLPKDVGNLSSLTTLNLYKCSNLVSLPNEVENLSSLTTLDLRRCSSLVSLPKEVGYLSSLTTLNLFKCSSLVCLPKEVENWSSLTTADLSGCSSLVSLPKEVGNLSALTTLDLNGCSSLVSLPKEVGNLFSLTTLNLYKCSSLVSLPKEVGNLSSLATLDLK